MEIPIEANLLKIKNLINEYEIKYDRPLHSVQLLGATKGQPLEKLKAVASLGLRTFGENYVQEAMEKMVSLTDYSLDWHFIGPIQSNKTGKIAAHFNWVQTLDDASIARRLQEMRPTHLPPLQCLIQVNISNETTKSGVTSEALFALADYCMTLPRLSLRGLMAIPAPQKKLDEQRREFHKLFLLWQSLKDRGFNLDTLSMGMSDDFEAAIAEGSTLVRIGSSLFGPRS